MTKTPQELRDSRPTSPHLTIYRLPISAILSIGHRITGACMYFSFLIMSWWFIGWVFSKFDPYYIELADCFLARSMLFLTSYALFYHLSTGIRHLIWDLGCGFKIEQIIKSSWLIVSMSFILTAAFWTMVL